MKQIDKLILKNFIGPFILTTIVVVFIFLMRFIMMYFEDFVGKDIGLSVFGQIILYFSLITVPVSLPLSTLLAALISFGNLGEHTELTAMKSAGIPLWRIVAATFILSVFIAIFSFVYNDKVTPWANLKGYSLLYDIKVTKVTLNIKEGMFYREIPGYSIKVKEKDVESNFLKDVTVYDHTSREGNINVTLADSGKMYTIYNDAYLVFELYNGTNYIEQRNKSGSYDDTPLVVNRFKKNKLVLSLESFGLKKTDESQFKYHEYMKDISELNAVVDSFNYEINTSAIAQIEGIKRMNSYQFKEQTANIDIIKDSTDQKDSVKVILPGKWVEVKYANTDRENRKQEIAAVMSSGIKSFKNQLETNFTVLSSKRKSMKSAQIEKWHKYTYAVACIVMFIIGSFLGAIIKKGGFGLPVVVAVSFFIFYYVLMQLGDKYAKEGLIPVLVGVWFPNIVLSFIAAFLAIKATKDAPLFQIDRDGGLFKKYNSIIKKLRPRKVMVS